jgi:DNA invertase Pin-like site-specific DNA recombinase
MEKAFVYLRVSGQGQAKEDKDGLVRQEDACRQWAKANGFEVAGTYREEGVSGTLEDRPALARLMVDLELNGHGVKTVIIEKLDRLARDLMVQEAIVRDFKRQGFNIISALEGPDLCSNDPSRILVRQIFGAVAEYDKAMLVLKLRAARERKKAKVGKCEGRKRYGEEDPQEQNIIQRVRAMRRTRRNGTKGMTLQEICNRLNTEGVKTKEGAQWNPTQVSRLLQSKKGNRACS